MPAGPYNWSGVALRGGRVLVGGLRGKLLRSPDGGGSWKSIKIDSKSSITGLTTNGLDGAVGTGLEGLVLTSSDGENFTERRLAGDPVLTAALPAADGVLIVSSREGISRIEGSRSRSSPAGKH